MSNTATVTRPADSPTASMDTSAASNCNTVSDTHSATAPASPSSSASTPTPTTPATRVDSYTSRTTRLSSTSSSALTPTSPPSPSNPLALPSSSSYSSSSPSPSSPSSAARRSCLLRLASDLKSLENDPPEGIDASPVDSSNLLLWRGCLFGPPDSEWEGAVLPLQLSFPPDYPQKPPVIRFTCRLFHPNVFSDGKLCLDICQDKWSPIYTVGTVLTSVQSLLTDPNTASPANSEAAQLWCSDRKEYRKQVRQCVARISGM